MLAQSFHFFDFSIHFITGRNPNWAGPLPLRVHNDPRQRANIERERAQVAAERGVTAVKLKEPEPSPNAGGGAPVSLVDLLSSSGFMTLDDALVDTDLAQIDLTDLASADAPYGLGIRRLCYCLW